MSERINFGDRIPKLSEEHIKQICRFTNIPYVEGDWQRGRAYAEFKKWHHNELNLRDIAELEKEIKELEKQFKKFAPTPTNLNYYIRKKDKLIALVSGRR